MRQPDKFEQIVRNAVRGQGTTNSRWYLHPEDAAKLLRKQHAAYVRMVKRAANANGDLGLSRSMKLDLLAAFDRYKKGAP